MQIVSNTDIKEYPLLSRGKVRDIYEIDPETLLIITTDRMSAFDVIMAQPIPYKGVVLNQITLFWLKRFASVTANHLLSSDIKDFPKNLASYEDILQGRSMLVKKARPLPVECIVRGHITGSGWKDYLASGKLCGYDLPKNMQESQKLETPLFTPSTKAEQGEHDENITVEQARDMVGDLFDKTQQLSLEIFSQAREYAAKQGIIIADTKFEFGQVGDELILIDEVLTPDSSRFWPQQGYQPGKSQPSFDKQYLRDWLSTQDWNKTPPPPPLPENIIENTRQKYFDAYELLTTQKLCV